jgi:hypothetical protein
MPRASLSHFSRVPHDPYLSVRSLSGVTYPVCLAFYLSFNLNQNIIHLCHTTGHIHSSCSLIQLGIRWNLTRTSSFVMPPPSSSSSRRSQFKKPTGPYFFVFHFYPLDIREEILSLHIAFPTREFHSSKRCF